jgi:hypothetical protein
MSLEDSWCKFDFPGVFRKIRDDQHLLERSGDGHLSHQHGDYLLGVRAQLSYTSLRLTAWYRVTQREDEAKETWRQMDEQKQEQFKNSPLANWGFEGEGLVKGAHRLVKVRIKDTPKVTPDSDRVLISTVSTIAPS